ncbi:MAG: iron-containing alcohol dehydrogenase [Pelolinea sp.]|nr:iron-containing alcohol dehydrogenase [Pelolinea sp.]
MPEHIPIMIGDDMIEKFIEYCQKNEYEKFLIVADENTARVLGDDVHQAVQIQGWDAIYYVLDPDGLHSDDVTLTRVLNAYDAVPRLFVAVGSGTITDTARFTSHRSQNKFVSFPTAASVDAYTSKNAPITIGGLKGSVYCHAPTAIFTDLPTICAAPKFLTASGFGDLISKLTSSSDWKITHLVWGSDFNEAIYKSVLQAAQKAADVVDGIRASDPESMAVMMEGQFASGFCMADFGNSAPASGAEHHIAHIWEMMFHWEKKEGLFHGNAVGVAAIQCAEWYQHLRALSREDAQALLDHAVIPPRDQQIKALKEHLPIIADELIESDPIYLQLSDPKLFTRIRERMLDQWDEIQAVAAYVLPPDVICGWIKSLGGPVTTQELELTQEQAETALEYGHYLRERFSINIIRVLFGW